MVKRVQNRIELVTRPSYEGGSTFKQQLMEKYQAVHADHDQLLSSHANKCRSLLIFATDLYLQMKENNPSDTADSGTVNMVTISFRGGAGTQILGGSQKGKKSLICL